MKQAPLVNAKLTKLEQRVHFKKSQQVAGEGAATPLPSRGGVPFGRGGVCNILIANKILTPPLPLPYKGGEWLRIDFYSNFGMFGLFQVDSIKKLGMILTKHEETKKGRLFHENEKLRIFVSSCSINYLYQVIILSSHKSM